MKLPLPVVSILALLLWMSCMVENVTSFPASRDRLRHVRGPRSPIARYWPRFNFDSRSPDPVAHRRRPRTDKPWRLSPGGADLDAEVNEAMRLVERHYLVPEYHKTKAKLRRLLENPHIRQAVIRSPNPEPFLGSLVAPLVSSVAGPLISSVLGGGGSAPAPALAPAPVVQYVPAPAPAPYPAPAPAPQYAPPPQYPPYGRYGGGYGGFGGYGRGFGGYGGGYGGYGGGGYFGRRRR